MKEIQYGDFILKSGKETKPEDIEVIALGISSFAGYLKDCRPGCIIKKAEIITDDRTVAYNFVFIEKENEAMKQYIGTKIIQAEPAYRVDGKVFEKANIVPCGVHIEDGYKVVYPDGYESWSPKDVFEAAYRETTCMNFGLAIEAAKMGKKIARAGWNGKNQYVELAYCISYKNNAAEIVNVNHYNIGNKALAFVGTSGVQMGWLASQADMLADDWYIVE